MVLTLRVAHFLSVCLQQKPRVQMFKVWKVRVGLEKAKPCSQQDPWKHQNTVCRRFLWWQPFSYLLSFYEIGDEWGFPRAFTHGSVISLGLTEYFKQMKTKKASRIIQCLIAFPHVSPEKHNSPLSSFKWLPGGIWGSLTKCGMFFQHKESSVKMDHGLPFSVPGSPCITARSIHLIGCGGRHTESSPSFSKLSLVPEGHELLHMFWGVNWNHSP